MTCGMMTCEMNNLEIRVKFVFSPDVILCGWLGSKHQLTNQLTVGLQLLFGTSLICCCWRGRHQWPCYRGFDDVDKAGADVSSWLPTKLHAKPCRKPSRSLWKHNRSLAGAGHVYHSWFLGWRSALWCSSLLWSLPVLRRWSSPLVASVWSSAWLCKCKERKHIHNILIIQAHGHSSAKAICLRI